MFFFLISSLSLLLLLLFHINYYYSYSALYSQISDGMCDASVDFVHRGVPRQLQSHQQDMAGIC